MGNRRLDTQDVVRFAPELAPLAAGAFDSQPGSRLPIALAASRISAALLTAAERHLHRRRLAQMLLRLSLRAAELGRRMAIRVIEGSRFLPSEYE